MTAEPTINVCSYCLRRCCWIGSYQCDEASSGAVTTKTEAELRALNYEDPDWYEHAFAAGGSL